MPTFPETPYEGMFDSAHDMNMTLSVLCMHTIHSRQKSNCCDPLQVLTAHLGSGGLCLRLLGLHEELSCWA